MPAALRVKMGVLEILYAMPIGFDRCCSSPECLGALRWTTGALLLLGAVGLRSRVVVPLAALGCLLIGGILRQYAHFYHAGLIPLYVLVALSFTPCGDGLSLDAWLARRRGRPVADPDRPRAVYGWSRYACWMMIALPYFLAGMSKLRFGGSLWWTPASMKNLLIRSNLDGYAPYFDFNGGLFLAQHAPYWTFGVLGAAAIAGELGYISVLFSRRARIIFPAATALMHAGILFIQNIAFFDLIPLQLAFVNWDRLLRACRAPSATVVATPPEELARVTIFPRVIGGVALALLVAWSARLERYPFTAMQMFTRVDRSTVVTYHQLRAVTESGEVFDPRVERVLPGPSVQRHRRDFWKLLDPARRARAEQLLEVVAGLMNRDAAPGRRIVRFEVVKKVWDYGRAPDDQGHGQVVERVAYDVRGVR